MTTTKADGPDFASSSLPRHLVRGLIGFGSLIGAVAFIPTVGPAACCSCRLAYWHCVAARCAGPSA